jgi:hypothetical protein
MLLTATRILEPACFFYFRAILLLYTNRPPALRFAYSSPSRNLRTCRHGARGGAVGSGTALHTIMLRVRFPMLSLGFFIDIIFQAALCVWGWLILLQLRVPGGRCVGLTTLRPSYTDCHEIWELQPPGTLRVCPGLYRDCFNFFFLHADTDLRVVSLLFAILRKAAIFIMFVCPSVRLLACSDPTGRILIKFDIWGFLKNPSGKFKFH